jgi:hypothetical protein
MKASLLLVTSRFLANERSQNTEFRSQKNSSHTALTAAMRYILKAESDDRRGATRKLYCIIAGSAVKEGVSRWWLKTFLFCLTTLMRL